MALQTLTKTEAATRQLHLAVELYFQDADPLAIHTLAGAAHGLTGDLLRHSNPEAYGRELENIHPDSRALVKRMISEAKNFLKHADRDPDSVLQFNPDWNDFLLMQAISRHIKLVGSVDLRVAIFLVWLLAKYPALAVPEYFAGVSIAELREAFPKLEKAGFTKRRIYEELMRLSTST
jgi:hypothetical protein